MDLMSCLSIFNGGAKQKKKKKKMSFDDLMDLR